MEIIRLDKDFGVAVMKAAGVLRRGGVVLYPTDTLYGLGADALSEGAIEKVYAIKGRDARKPLHAVVADLAMAARYAVVNDLARKLAERFLPGPLTLILQKRDDANPALSKGRTEFAIRVPNNEFCLELARTFDGPYTTTSANASGEQSQPTVEKILEQLGSAAAHIDLVIDAGPLLGGAPSTIVNVISGHPSILRAGAIPTDDIMKAAA